MRSYQDTMKRKLADYGDKFDSSDLNPAFIPYYENQERVKVMFQYGEEKFGTIGMTTGWKPVFLLMHDTRCMGSSDVIGKNDKVLAVQNNGKYQTV